MTYKELLSALAILVTLGAFYPYIRGILAGRITPHVFSWMIWGSTTLVVFFAQLHAQGGAGAWAIGVSAVITIFIALLAYARRADASIATLDWAFFLAALSSLPLWYVTADPLWAVVVLTVVDLLGFGPTVRKAYRRPQRESLPFFGLFLLRNGLVILALENYSLTTVLFPATVAAACALLMALIVWRRRVLAAGALS